MSQPYWQKRRQEWKEKKAQNQDEWKKQKFQPFVKNNEAFNTYYQTQGIVPAGEWDAFVESLKKHLPSSFRICATAGFADELKERLEKEFLTEGKPQENGPYPLKWYPNGLAWACPLSKEELRSSGRFANFRQLIISEHEKGNINRQEAVSMIPPLLLDVKPHHAVLDMCAAPGSKTAQLLEALHAGVPADQIPSGVVIANDADGKRAFMLVHQVKRLGSPCFLVSNHEGQFFPNLFTQPQDEKKDVKDDGDSLARLEFDRILCDVPCSGDGTFRKQPDIWKRWTHKHGNGLHKLQIDIASRAAHMLKVGGLMVYSTCSFNPIENEAVVAELLRKFKGCLELVDVSHMLPGLIRRPGIHHWKVCVDQGAFVTTWEESQVRPTGAKLPRSYFCPADDEKFPLERCMRVLPHDQDTGGFFICLLRKTAPCPKLDEIPEAQMSKRQMKKLRKQESVVNPVVEENKQKKRKQAGEFYADHSQDPFVPLLSLPNGAQNLQKIRDDFGLRADFPVDTLFCRSEGAKRIYVVSPAIAPLLRYRESNHKLKLVHAGVRVFEIARMKSSGPENWHYRIAQDGLHIAFPFMTKRVLPCGMDDFITFLCADDMVKFSELSAETAQTAAALENATAIVALSGDASKVSSQPICLCTSKSSRGFTVMASLIDRKSMLNMLLPFISNPSERVLKVLATSANKQKGNQGNDKRAAKRSKKAANSAESMAEGEEASKKAGEEEEEEEESSEEAGDEEESEEEEDDE